MTQTKTYKSKIAAKFGILLSRIKNKFNGSKLVVENYTIKYNTITKECTVDMNFMTEAEEKQLHTGIAEQQAKIMEMLKNEIVTETPTLERQAKAEKWAEAVEKNRQKQLAENKSKKKSGIELTDAAADEIVNSLKNRGVYNGEPKAKKPAKSKTKKAPKVKNNTN